MMQVIKRVLDQSLVLANGVMPLFIFAAIMAIRVKVCSLMDDKLRKPGTDFQEKAYSKLLNEWILKARESGFVVEEKRLFKNSPVVISLKKGRAGLIINSKHKNTALVYAYFRVALNIVMFYDRYKFVNKLMKVLNDSIPFAALVLLYASIKRNVFLIIMSNIVLTMGFMSTAFAWLMVSYKRLYEIQHDEEVLNLMEDEDKLLLDFPMIYKYPAINYASIILIGRYLIDLIIHGSLFFKLISIIFFLSITFAEEIEEYIERSKFAEAKS